MEFIARKQLKNRDINTGNRSKQRFFKERSM